MKLSTPTKVESILSIPLCRTNQDDMLIWRGMAKGIFPVRSAYHAYAKRAAGGGTS
jgi:hypothetical protein